MKMRASDRDAINARGHFAGVRSFGSAIAISDLTPDGCRISDRSGFLDRKSWLDLMIEGQGPFRARIRWRKNGEAGVSFDPEITEELFAEIRDCAHSEGRPQQAEAARRIPVERPAATLPRRFC